jgi:hypothetical protein
MAQMTAPIQAKSLPGGPLSRVAIRGSRRM